jgi:hypothetical protein
MKKISIGLIVALVGLTMATTAQGGISSQDALNRTFHYAKHACKIDKRCRAAAASECQHHNHGVSCWAWNYERTNHKYTCKRLIFWTKTRRAFLTKWKCDFNGWGWGPGVK